MSKVDDVIVTGHVRGVRGVYGKRLSQIEGPRGHPAGGGSIIVCKCGPGAWGRDPGPLVLG